MRSTEGSAPPASAPASRIRAIVPTVATVLVIVLCVAAGNWQRGRMHDKEALRAQLEAAAAAPPVSLPSSDTDWNAWRFRRVIARGTFIAQRQFLLDNRV
ncbi:MAG TPA: SURF1 family cytochrome oxidase biogenesis protein, partial [Casimicrobiaceae bacterium]|nr:SURF1 family cytochrome oxidase biogenesis protein [Casimicrobiaceae bacterium]